MTKTAARNIDTAERRAFLLKWRRLGLSYSQLADKAIEQFGADALPQGFDRVYAHKDVTRELEKLLSDMREDAEAIRQLQIERCNELLMSMYARATGTHADYKAVDRVVKLMQQLDRYYGLDVQRQDININEPTQFVVTLED